MHSVDGYFRNGELHQVLAMTSFHGLEYDLILLWNLVSSHFGFEVPLGYCPYRNSPLCPRVGGRGGEKVGNDGFNLPTV